MPKVKCSYCKKRFEAKRKTAKYCNVNCRNNAAYERKTLEKEMNPLAEKLAKDLKEKQ